MLDNRTALEAVFRLGCDTHLEFVRGKNGGGPLLYVLVKAREDAIEALCALVNADPADVEHVRKLQNEVQRFIDLVAYTKQLLAASDEAEAELNQHHAEAVREAMSDQTGDD